MKHLILLLLLQVVCNANAQPNAKDKSRIHFRGHDGTAQMLSDTFFIVYNGVTTEIGEEIITADSATILMGKKIVIDAYRNVKVTHNPRMFDSCNRERTIDYRKVKIPAGKSFTSDHIRFEYEQP